MTTANTLTFHGVEQSPSGKMANCFELEFLPDEILLEIYRYLHCGHVLYSFHNLNSRLNRTITDYCQHVILRRLNYRQFRYLYSNILPEIGPLVRSLTVNRLQQTEFVNNFSHRMNTVFPHLEKLALDDWLNTELFAFLGHHLSELKHLRTIIMRGLRKSNPAISLGDTVGDYHHLLDIISKNTQIEIVDFEPDCYSMMLLANGQALPTRSNLVELHITLDTSNDLVCLASLLLSIRRLYVIVEEVARIEQDAVPFRCLTHFSLDAADAHSTLETISSILRLIPTVQDLSLVLTAHDDRLIYGEYLRPYLPSKLFDGQKFVESFQYAVYFSSSVDYTFDSNHFLRSWKSLPMVHTINSSPIKTHIFIHTIPYPSILLNLNFPSQKKFGIKTGDQVYSRVQYLCIMRAKSLGEIFPVIEHCRKIQDLTIQIDAYGATSAAPASQQATPRIPLLKRLEILSIFGLIDNWQHLNSLILAAHNLSTLCLDLTCTIGLLETNDDDLIFPRILHLFLDGQQEQAKLTNENVLQLAKKFNGIHSLRIKHKSEEIINGNILGAILDQCKHLIVFAINGQLPSDSSLEHFPQWLMEYSSRLRNSEKNYQIEFIDDCFQIWL